MAKGDLGNLIKKERKKKYDKASNFAKILGISSAHLSDIEKGNRLPSKILIEKILDELKSKDFKEEKVYDLLAEESNDEKKIPMDIREYMIQNKELLSLIRVAKENNIQQDFWINVKNEINNKGE